MRHLVSLLLLGACRDDKAPAETAVDVETCVPSASPFTPRDEPADDTGEPQGTWDADEDGDGWTLAEGDCDDYVATVNPGYVEVPGNGVDEDCDGSDAGPTQRLADAPWRWDGKNNYTAGTRLALAGDTNGDGVAELMIGAPDAGASNDHDNLNDRVFLLDLAGDGLAPARATITPELYGGALGSGGLIGGFDADGDGYDDVAVGLPTADINDGIQYGGEVRMYFGPLAGTLAEGDADQWIHGNLNTFGLGRALAVLDPGVGPVTLVVAYNYGAAVWALPKGDVGLLGDPVGVLAGPDGVTAAGSRLVSGDLDGDGLDDLLAGDPTAIVDGVSYAGRVDVLFGPFDPSNGVADRMFSLGGDREKANAGYAIDIAGDTNGDGYSDVLVGAAAHPEVGDNGGKAWLFEGPVVESASLTDAAWSLLPEHKFDRLGEAVAGLGDANGDGLADLAVSAPRQTSYGVFYPGRVYVFSAPFEGTQTGAEADLVLQGEGIADFAGATLLGGRDLDGDCLPDLLVAAPERDDDGKDAGAVYLLTGLSW